MLNLAVQLKIKKEKKMTKLYYIISGSFATLEMEGQVHCIVG